MVQIRALSSMSPAELVSLKQRAESNIEDVLPTVAEMISQIRQRGDAAVIEYAQRFDFAGTETDNVQVREEEFATAERELSDDVAAAIRDAHANILKFHRKQMPEEMWFAEISEGIFAGERVTPIPSTALYVPRGKGAFPSVMLMLAVPATVAGVERILVCTPPDEQGGVDPATRYAAQLCGIREIYKLGGAHAVAAVALGTKTFPKVDKIVGPGSIYASAAKRLLYGTVDVGLPAGPSEAIVLADEHTDPRIAALDLLIEAEHGPDSAALLVTHCETTGRRVAELAQENLEKLPPWRRDFCSTVLSSYGGVLLTSSLEESIAFINDYAPEHLEILTREPFHTLGRIRNAGEILLGPHTPISVANYCLGLNAILPTGGFAKSYSSVSVKDFLKSSGVGYMNATGFERLKETTACLADFEGFPAHALAVRERAAFLPSEAGRPPAAS